ncbi:MAG TPA: UDP-3-O-(3-hydroxymyristoyl)glucosamine N-acyltransferase, partial [Terriglobales bacterium]
IARLSSFREADPSSLVFAMTAEAFTQALASNAGAIIAGDFARQAGARTSVIVHSQPKLAFARAAKLLAPQDVRVGVHPSAVVHASAAVADGAGIDAYAVIGADVRISRGTRVGAHAVISDGCEIGEDCTIYPHVSIYAGTKIGNRVVVHSGAVLGSDGFGYVQDAATGRYEQFPQLGRLVIEDDVEIGANTTIDRGALELTTIHRGTKLDNLVHIAHNVEVGADVVIAAQTGISGSSVIEDRAVIAGQVGIADHVRIESGAILGAQCGVPSGKVIRGPGVLFWGTPARPIKEYLRQLAVLARLARK